MTELLMPKLSDTMEEGTIIAWLKEDGTPIVEGDPIVEIETDKANMTVESEVDGILQIIANEGDTLAVGQLIAAIGDGTAVTPTAAAGPPEPTLARIAPISAAEPAAPGVHGERIRATPLAKRIAGDRGVDLRDVRGSGPGGRIVADDIPARGEGAGAGAGPADDSTSQSEGKATGAKGAVTRLELTRSQSIVARRMSEAKATVPEFQVEALVDMTAAIELRGRIRDVLDGEPTPSLNDLIIKACGLALRRFPKANACYADDGFELFERVNVGFAVAAEDALVVPTVFDADKKSLGEIGNDTRRLAERVREGRVSAPELAGATFTLSNLGMFGVSAMTPIVNTPQAAILGVGATRAVLGRQGGELVERQEMQLTLTCDHRILYGADAAQFLMMVVELLEQPLKLTL